MYLKLYSDQKNKEYGIEKIIEKNIKILTDSVYTK